MNADKADSNGQESREPTPARTAGQSGKSKPLAHTAEDGRMHLLSAHLRATADLAAGFASAFNADDWGRLAGRWHDLGKYSSAFQAYLRRSNDNSAHLEGRPGRVDHSTAGAAHAVSHFPQANSFAGRVLAYCIAGHHAGLTDWDTASDASLSRRLANPRPETADAIRRAPVDILESAPPARLALQPAPDRAEMAFQVAMLTRMLFSCLTDADFLDTESFMDRKRSADRREPAASLATMNAALGRHLQEKSASAERTLVNQRRREILDACRAAAELPTGFFSLTVPTGGGKTLSSLAFALSHALPRTDRPGLRRVIYAIPYTSIIEQTAEVFREALGELGETAVLEHHSNFDPAKETPWSRLACENWDAPLVVTTNVQLFDSLFASRTSRCRKLHNLARSVIVLDEVQTLPVDYLHPCLAVLRELVRNYGCTVVLCTATQPAVHRRGDFPIGIDSPREIVPDPAGLYEQMKRVRVSFAGTLDDETLIERLRAQRQVLCIANTKAHAARLYRALAGDDSSGGEARDTFHLSASMCPAHRSATLAEIKRRLDEKLPCRLIATPVVEAGVDIDFPVVYRAMAGLDSIAQAAGRCNREGRADYGEVFVFDASEPPPKGTLRQTAETARELIGLHDDLLGLDAIEHYFRLHYWQKKSRWDSKAIMGRFRMTGRGDPLCDFRSAAEDFRLIPDNTKPVLIPWKRRGRELIEQLRAADPFPPRDLRRALQRYTVSVYEGVWTKLERAGALEILHDQYPVLIWGDEDKDNSFYSSDIGLSPPGDSMGSLIV